MPWLFNTTKAGATYGLEGKVFWARPDSVALGTFREVSLPSGVNAVGGRPSWSQGPFHMYAAGAWTDNMVLTGAFKFWPLGLRAPNVVPTVAASAGAGITGEIICYLAYYDAHTDEWSPLSAASATFNLANQQLTWSSLPTPDSARVTHIGFWRSVDGSLPRLVALREIGATSFVDSLAVGDLGEAFVDDFTKFPRCRYSEWWHEMLVLAGDDDHPDTLYLSIIGKGERHSRITLKTKSGQPIVGLVNVRGTLVVLCPTASEIVSGWTENDLAIEIAQPHIGCISHHGIAVIHGLAWIPTHLGLYVCDGSGWFYVSDDIASKWASEYKARRAAYEDSWAVHDPVSGVYKLYVGTHTDTSGNTYWTADYTPVTPQTGGGMGQPNWSYDVSTRSYDSAGLLAVPGGRRFDVYSGACNGFVYKENEASENDDVSDGATAKKMKVRWGALFFGDYGGDFAHGKKWQDITMFVEAESNAWVLNIYHGDEKAYPMVAPFTKSIAASAVANYQPKTTHHFKLPRVSGRAIVVEILGTTPVGMVVRGFQPSWTEGYARRGRTANAGPPI